MTLALSTLLASGHPPDGAVAIGDGQTRSYARFAADVAGVAAAVQGSGSHRVAVVCDGSYAFCVGLFGALHAGADIVLPPNGQPGTLQSLRPHFDLLADDAFVAHTQGAAVATWQALPTDRPALSFFTSGSTGTPKRITKTLGQLEREIATLQTLWGENSGAPVCSTVSHQHVYGLTFKLLWPLAAGRPFVDETDAVWETLLARLTAGAEIVSSPAHLERLSGLLPLPAQCRPIRVFSAGAPLSFAAATASKGLFGRRPTEIFGSTETGAFASRVQRAGAEPWRLLPGIEMRCDDNGRLSLRAPYVAGDWFETADLVEPTAEGFHHRGRADRIVKIEGKRISLADVDQALGRLPEVTAAASVVLPETPPRLAAAVVLSADGRRRLAELGGFRFGRMLRDALADTQEAAGRPRAWRFVAALPSGPMGKRRDADMIALFSKAQS